MEKINKFLRSNPKYKRLQKPLEAARVCDIARKQLPGHVKIVSFIRGVLCLSTQNSAEASNLQCESALMIDLINKKIGENLVKRFRFKIEN